MVHYGLYLSGGSSSTVTNEVKVEIDCDSDEPGACTLDCPDLPLDHSMVDSYTGAGRYFQAFFGVKLRLSRLSLYNADVTVRGHHARLVQLDRVVLKNTPNRNVRGTTQFEDTTVEMREVSILNVIGSTAGPAIRLNKGSLTACNSHFEGNNSTTTSKGGAIHCYNGGISPVFFDSSQLGLHGCSFANNSAQHSGFRVSSRALNFLTCKARESTS